MATKLVEQAVLGLASLQIHLHRMTVIWYQRVVTRLLGTV